MKYSSYILEINATPIISLILPVGDSYELDRSAESSKIRKSIAIANYENVLAITTMVDKEIGTEVNLLVHLINEIFADLLGRLQIRFQDVAS